MTDAKKYNYRLDFRPLDVYFFGGELTFGNGDEVNYFAKTRPYPQQTTVLGVLRYLGYYAEGIGDSDIGESFAAEEDDNQGKYGYINALSPLFFREEPSGDSYIHGPLMNGAQGSGAPVAAGAPLADGRRAKTGKRCTNYRLLTPKTGTTNLYSVRPEKAKN